VFAVPLFCGAAPPNEVLAPAPNAGVLEVAPPVKPVEPPPKRLPLPVAPVVEVPPKAGFVCPKRLPEPVAAPPPNPDDVPPPNPPKEDPAVAVLLPPPNRLPLLEVVVVPKPVLFWPNGEVPAVVPKPIKEEVSHVLPECLGSCVFNVVIERGPEARTASTKHPSRRGRQDLVN